jgi:hypothetical protein
MCITQYTGASHNPHLLSPEPTEACGPVLAESGEGAHSYFHHTCNGHAEQCLQVLHSISANQQAG